MKKAVSVLLLCLFAGNVYAVPSVTNYVTNHVIVTDDVQAEHQVLEQANRRFDQAMQVMSQTSANTSTAVSVLIGGMSLISLFLTAIGAFFIKSINIKKIELEEIRVNARDILFQLNDYKERIIKMSDELKNRIPVDKIGIEKEKLAPSIRQQVKEAANSIRQKQAFEKLNANEYFILGIDEYNDNRFDEAVMDYTYAIAIDGNYTEAWVNRGNVYSEKGEYVKAMEDYNRAILINPSLKEAYNNRACTFYIIGDYENSIKDCSRAIAIDNNYKEPYYNRGRAYNELKQYDKAILDFTKAISLDKEYRDAYLNRGISFFEKEEYEQAISDYSTILSFGEYKDAYVNRGNVYCQKGEYDKAILDYTRAIMLDPDDMDVLSWRGNVYFEKKQFENALADFNSALRINSSYLDAIAGKAIALFRIGRVDEAKELFKKIYVKNKDFKDELEVDEKILFFENFKAAFRELQALTRKDEKKKK